MMNPSFKYQIKNKQKTIANRAWTLAAIFCTLMLMPFFENNLFTGAWALSFFALFLLMASIITAIVFGNRSRKMKKLLSGQKLIAQWQLNRENLSLYIDESYQLQKEKNKALLWIMGIFFALFTIIFLFILEDDERLIFFTIMLSIFLIILIFGIFMPKWYRYRNKQAAGVVLIGSKYLYINGSFHNWDYPLSGLKRLKAIEKPYHGINLVYYYTDRTGTNSYELKIPVPYNIDIQELIDKIWKDNS